VYAGFVTGGWLVWCMRVLPQVINLVWTVVDHVGTCLTRVQRTIFVVSVHKPGRHNFPPSSRAANNVVLSISFLSDLVNCLSRN
jgi:hypothetical protein